LFVTFLLCGKPVAYRKLTHLSVSPRKMSFSDTPIILLCIWIYAICFIHSTDIERHRQICSNEEERKSEFPLHPAATP